MHLVQDLDPLQQRLRKHRVRHDILVRAGTHHRRRGWRRGLYSSRGSCFFCSVHWWRVVPVSGCCNGCCCLCRRPGALWLIWPVVLPTPWILAGCCCVCLADRPDPTLCALVHWRTSVRCLMCLPRWPALWCMAPMIARAVLRCVGDHQVILVDPVCHLLLTAGAWRLQCLQRWHRSARGARKRRRTRSLPPSCATKARTDGRQTVHYLRVWTYGDGQRSTRTTCIELASFSPFGGELLPPLDHAVLDHHLCPHYHAGPDQHLLDQLSDRIHAAA